MNCREVKEKITLFIEGELEEGEAKLIYQHIQSCPDCQRLYEEMRHFLPLLSKLSVEPPAALEERLISIPQQQEKSRRWGWIPWIEAAVAASLAVLLLLMPLLRPLATSVKEKLSWGYATVASTFATVKKVGTKFIIISFEIKEELEKRREQLKDRFFAEKEKKRKKEKDKAMMRKIKKEVRDGGNQVLLSS